MHTYKFVDGGWEVGHFEWTGNGPQPPTQNWYGLRVFDEEAKAAAYCCYLNGGDHPSKQPWPSEWR